MAIFNVTNNPGIVNSFNSWITTIEETTDGDLMIYGNFTSYNTTSANNIIKIDTNGVIQTDFDYGSGFTSGVSFYQSGIAIDASNDIYVGGQFTAYKGTSAKNIVKIKADGDLDTLFVYGTGATDNYLLRPLITSGGLIFYVGRSTNYNGTTTNRLFKVSPLGILDAAYDTNVGDGFDNVSIQALDAGTGKIYVHGYFSSYNGDGAANNICRINADGTLDSSFNVGIGLNNSDNPNANDGIIDSGSGNLVMIGNFTNYKSTNVGGIVRINSNGTIDTSFVQTTGFTGGRPFNIVEGANGQYLVSGTFTQYNGVTVPTTVLLDNDGDLDTGFNFIPPAGFDMEWAEYISPYFYCAAPNYTSGRYYIVRIDDNGNKIFI